MSRFVLKLIFVLLEIRVIIGHSLKECETSFFQDYLNDMEAKKDVTTEPCDDFYTHACGNWDPGVFWRKRGAHDTLTYVKARNMLTLRLQFELAEKNNTLDKAWQMGRERKCLLDFYRSCMSMQLEDRNVTIQKFADVLRHISDWPVLNPNFSESTANESFNWEFVSAHLRRYGANSFWRTLVQPNWQNTEQFIIYIVPPSFGFFERSKRKYTDDTNDDDFFLHKNYVKYLFLNMGLRVRKALAFADEVVRFERSLMSLIDENSEILKAPQTLASLANELPGIRLQKFFDVLLQDVTLPNNYAQDLLIAADKTYLLKLGKLLEETKAETIGKYLFIQFLVHYEVSLHNEQSYSMTQEHCVEQANTFLPKELSNFFLDLMHEGRGIEFLLSTQSKLTQIFDNMKQVFESLINDTNIFDHNSQTRADGLEKLHAMQLMLPDLKDETECDAHQNILLDSENYVLNLLHHSQSKAFQELLIVNKTLRFRELGDNWKLTKNVDTFTNYGPLDVNAYYRLSKNAIEIPVGLLSLPIYDNCLVAPMTYGTIAFVVGHELMHGFDYDGFNYDKTGNVVDGWDPKSIIAFGSKASCYLGKRYDNAFINVNENIADSEGLRLALGALQKVAGPLRSSDWKLFFTSFAHIWCRAPNDHVEIHSLHATSRERVNNVLSNLQVFAETFECASGSVMNPDEKCHIW